MHIYMINRSGLINIIYSQSDPFGRVLIIINIIMFEILHVDTLKKKSEMLANVRKKNCQQFDSKQLFF